MGALVMTLLALGAQQKHACTGQQALAVVPAEALVMVFCAAQSQSICADVNAPWQSSQQRRSQPTPI